MKARAVKHPVGLLTRLRSVIHIWARPLRGNGLYSLRSPSCIRVSALRVTIAARKKQYGTPRRGQSVPGLAFGDRYADPPAAALLTGLRVGEWSPLTLPPMRP